MATRRRVAHLGVQVDPQAPDPGISEKRFQQRVELLAKFYGWVPYHTFDSRRSAKGMLDLAMYREPAAHGDSYHDWSQPPCPERRCEIVFAELKVGKRKLTPEQQGWLDAFHHAGMEAYEWRWPTDVPFICERLARGRVRLDPDWALQIA